MIARPLELGSYTSRAMYSRGILGSCFWKSVLRPVKMVNDRGLWLFSTGTICMTPLRISVIAAFSTLTGGYVYVSNYPDVKMNTMYDIHQFPGQNQPVRLLRDDSIGLRPIYLRLWSWVRAHWFHWSSYSSESAHHQRAGLMTLERYVPSSSRQHSSSPLSYPFHFSGDVLLKKRPEMPGAAHRPHRRCPLHHWETKMTADVAWPLVEMGH